MSENEAPKTVRKGVFVTVTLDEPIVRGAQTIERVTLRKPGAGELRGLSLVDIGRLDIISLQKLLPRITDPGLTEADVAGMDIADLLEIGSEISDFLLRKADKPVFPTS